MRRVLVAVVVTAVFVAPVARSNVTSDRGRGNGKKPWELTTTERLALRTNPVMLQRLRITLFAMTAPGQSQQAETFRYRIEGRDHPELLLPFELFRNVLAGLRSNPDGAAILREAYAPVITRLNLPPDLLSQLVNLGDPYLAREARIERINTALNALSEQEGTALRSERTRLHAAQCPALAEALAAARQRFGAITFDRFLYEAVAPGFVVTMTEPDDVGELTRWEGGCR